MLKRIVSVAVCAAAATLAGCSTPAPAETQPADTAESTTAAAPATVAPSTEAVATPEMSPTPETPTVNQIASVIAQHEADWREVIEGASDCRFLTVVTDADEAEPFETLSATTCLLKESTMTLTADTVVDKLAGNGAPDEISDLTDDTIRTLFLISEAGVNEHCDPTQPFDKSDACSTALGTAIGQYDTLDRILDGWDVYIG